MNDDRIAALRNAVEYAYGARVEGDIIEFGVMSAFTAVALANAMMTFDGRMPDHPTVRNLWLCDSFEGFPVATGKIDPETPMIISGAWAPGTSRGGTPEQICYAMRDYLPPQRLHVVAGWFKDTAQYFANRDRKYALIHADCDFYESTKDALAPLFANGCISPGCMIAFDDWNANHADPMFGQRAAWRDLVEQFHIDASDEGPYAAYSHKFIVHGYRRD
jgi:hypothetical protein